VLDPSLALGEDERFLAASRLVGAALFPLGEAYCGHAFLGIDSLGRVYVVDDGVGLLGLDVSAALDAIIEGRLPQHMGL
jgi:hypothetical protein